jgi:hypothetical protein
LYCRKCGQEMAEQERFCRHCGQGVGLGQGAGLRPDLIPNHLAFSIIMLILFLPFGIAGLIYSLRVDEYLARGDTEGALYYSKKARSINIIGLIVLAALIVFCIILAVVVAIGFIPYCHVYF